jgi:hypothetical protein
MTHEGSHDHGAAPAAAPFSATELQAFQDEDVFAAKAVVLLMMGIFVLGLAGYTVVALWVRA